jgi:hypothetical protein
MPLSIRRAVHALPEMAGARGVLSAAAPMRLARHPLLRPASAPFLISAETAAHGLQAVDQAWDRSTARPCARAG